MTKDKPDTEALIAEVSHAIEIISMCHPIRDIQGGMWFNRNQNFADATFVDYGACEAFATAARSLPRLVETIRTLTAELAEAKAIAIKPSAITATADLIAALVKRAESAESELARLRAEAEWRPIDADTPRAGETPIMAFNSRHPSHAPVFVRWTGDSWCDAATSSGNALWFNENYFDFWKPLPSPPEGRKC